MVNDFGEVIAAFGAMVGNEANSAAKELNIINAHRQEAATNHKIGLPLNSLFL